MSTTAQRPTVLVTLPWEKAVTAEVSAWQKEDGVYCDTVTTLFDPRGLSDYQRMIAGEIRDALGAFLKGSVMYMGAAKETSEELADFLRSGDLPAGFKQGITYSPIAGVLHV